MNTDSVELKTELEKQQAVALLTDRVRELVGNPISAWAVAATIESIGVRDIDTEPDYGFDSVFILAEYIYDSIKEEIARENKNDNTSIAGENLEKPELKERIKLFLKYYSQGLVFSLPMISQIAAVLIFRYSLWAWLEFNEAQATIIAFGTIIAFVFTGGFIQTMGKLVSRYRGEQNYMLAFEASKRLFLYGVILVVSAGILIYILNIIIPFYPQGLIILGLIYMVLISLLLLSAAVLYALEQRFMILAGVLAGTVFVIFGMSVLNLGIYISQWTGIAISTVVICAYALLYYRLKIKNMHQKLARQRLPNPEVIYYGGYRYFIYGTCYFIFLFLDRILAWSAGPPPPPYIIWFNTPYELGMDWALISLVLSIAVLEYSIHAFSEQLIPAQRKAYFRQLSDFNSYFKSFYKRQAMILLVAGVASIFLTYIGINSLKVFADDVPEIRDFFANPMTTRVFWMASIGYLFLIFGLLHSLFFFTLNRPGYVMYSMLVATLVNFLVGYICSRVFSLEFAVAGLIAGSLTFAVLTGWLASRFFRNLDYYYYSAY